MYFIYFIFHNMFMYVPVLYESLALYFVLRVYYISSIIKH